MTEALSATFSCVRTTVHTHIPHSLNLSIWHQTKSDQSHTSNSFFVLFVFLFLLSFYSSLLPCFTFFSLLDIHHGMKIGTGFQFGEIFVQKLTKTDGPQIFMVYQRHLQSHCFTIHTHGKFRWVHVAEKNSWIKKMQK